MVLNVKFHNIILIKLLQLTVIGSKLVNTNSYQFL